MYASVVVRISCGTNSVADESGRDIVAIKGRCVISNSF